MNSAAIILSDTSSPDTTRSKVTEDIRTYLRNLCRFASHGNALVYLELWEKRLYSAVVEAALMRQEEQERLIETIRGMNYKTTEEYTTALLVELLFLQ